MLKEKYSDILYMPVCALHDSPQSREYLKECIEEAEHLEVGKNVRFVTGFLPNDESMKYLQACDIMAMTYKPSLESASGAIRFCLAACRPIVTTSQPIFEEFKDCTYSISSADKTEIASAIENLLDMEQRRRYVNAEKTHIRETSWHMAAEKFYELYRSLI